uniref:Uncharacterized protein n=1 Tax=Rhizophora mucronata TaxID=61149 RepID=A0A2P2PNJ8_RHIMU
MHCWVIAFFNLAYLIFCKLLLQCIILSSLILPTVQDCPYMLLQDVIS